MGLGKHLLSPEGISNHAVLLEEREKEAAFAAVLPLLSSGVVGDGAKTRMAGSKSSNSTSLSTFLIREQKFNTQNPLPSTLMHVLIIRYRLLGGM